ncbi:MAG TPA: ATP-binding protein [Bryobacteraceae bacterium]|nr:ATP-binding protein [Bryobacteraceae bacterium]
MWQERIARHIHAGAAERDEEFRHEIQRLSHIGLQVVGGVQIGVAAFMLLARFLVAPDPLTFRLRLSEGLLVIATGAACLLLSHIRIFYRYSRLLAALAGVFVTGVLIWYSLRLSAFDASADDFIPGQITLVMLVGVAAVPLRPTDTLLFGFLTESIYVMLSLLAQRLNIVHTGLDAIYVLFVCMLTLLATGLTAVVYWQRQSNYQAHLNTVSAAEDLRKAEARNLLTQNAASVGRLAAALSHELNSPIGALVSGVDTLLLLAARQATSSPSEHQRLVILQAELRKSVKESTDRLKAIIQRMQRFTNLDKAEIQEANLNDLLTDVTALMEPEYKGRAKVELDLQPVKPLVCRPQQLSAVFSNLLGNAVQALNGDGRVRVATRQADSQIEVSIEDNGRGVDQAELATIFDPGFKVSHGRVSTGNWSMFSSQQIVREHGGDIRIQSAPGEGTRIHVVLPCDAHSGGMQIS